jgi:hypothetical protein
MDSGVEQSDSEYSESVDHKKKTKPYEDVNIRVYDESDLFQNDKYVPDILYQVLGHSKKNGKQEEDTCCATTIGEEYMIPTEVNLYHTPHHIVVSKKIIPIIPLTVSVTTVVVLNLAIMMFFIDLLARGTLLTDTYFGIWVIFSKIEF